MQIDEVYDFSKIHEAPKEKLKKQKKKKERKKKKEAMSSIFT